ncbi:MAG: 3-dehydroquinate synthase [Halanaerobiales bacterium]|nr:3-dehydroquinate synthase [Halanaerobiales bacterium]
MTAEVNIDLKDYSYSVIVGNKNLDRIGEIINKTLPDTVRTFVISDTNVFSIYGDRVINNLKKAQLKPTYELFPAGEENKNLLTARKFYDKLVEHQMDRSSLIISLGGGVVGDLAGFVAATFMRGVKFAQLPTTLLAQVDSSVGGKVAVNHEKGKNLIGTFYQPDFVLTDVSTLNTLEKNEIISGMAEVIKHGMILDKDYFNYIDNNISEILDLTPTSLIQLVKKSCQLKGSVVKKDEKENDYRKILNFGHTIGHALEVITKYKKYKHGEAVSIGMVYNCKLAYKMGLIDYDVIDRLITLLSYVGLPTEIPKNIGADQILEAIKKDKKSYQNKVPMILPTAIGKVEISNQWSEEDLKSIIK